jgi:heme/copper-type cytochrome/quinol oxidase subunit 3
VVSTFSGKPLFGYRSMVAATMVICILLCFNLFWHALDIVWVAIFTVVYLMGAAQ